MSSLPRKPEAEGVEIVLLGSFNAAIFHPQWFRRYELVGDEVADKAELKVVSPEVTEVGLGDVNLQCLEEKVIFRVENVAYAEKLHDLANGVLALLPHTPIRACGITAWAHYRISSTEHWHRIGHTLAPKELIWSDLLEDPGMRKLTVTAAPSV